VNAVGSTLAGLRAQGRKALIPFLTAGYPDLPTFERLLETAADSGADVIEVGFPFSDPLADGPSIQHSSHTALWRGLRCAQTLACVGALQSRLGVPLAAMTYVNPVLSFGAARFAREAACCGFSAVVVPDLPFGSDPAISACFAEAGIEIIPLIAPTTTDARLELIAAHAGGFAYLVSVLGVTGVRSSLAPGLAELAGRVRARLDLPLCIGFGISGAAQAARLAQLGDGVITGSALVELIRASADNVKAVEAAGAALRALRAALDAAGDGAEGPASFGRPAVREIRALETRQ
jgi:tryptophan synthase alpha chain